MENKPKFFEKKPEFSAALPSNRGNDIPFVKIRKYFFCI